MPTRGTTNMRNKHATAFSKTVFGRLIGNIFHWFCRDPMTGTIFDLIVENITETLYREKTALRPQGGKWDAIQDWLFRSKRGGKFVDPPAEPIQLIEP